MIVDEHEFLRGKDKIGISWREMQAQNQVIHQIDMKLSLHIVVHLDLFQGT